jgi:hypothetical protein
MPRFPLFFLLSCLIVRAEEPSSSVAELRETISKIVDVQTLESGERLDWEAKKAEFTSLLELHQKEIELLTDELKQAGASAPGHLGSTEEMKAEIARLKETRRVLSEAVARNVPRSIALAQRFPEPLLKECEIEIITLKEWKADQEPRNALQSILTLITKAQQFNRRITRHPEVRDGREVEVMYLGLARAFYADKKKGAGIGEPGSEGWVWKSQPEIRSELLAAFDSLDKKRPPSMVKLPLRIR